jgi:alanyl-tRNA synthetase
VVSSLKEQLEETRRREKSLGLRVAALSLPQVISDSVEMKGAKLYAAKEGELGEELIIAEGQSAVKSEPSLVYLSVYPRGNSVGLICFVGSKAKALGVSADSVVKALAKLLGGSGGGSADFAQGGGPINNELPDLKKAASDIVSSLIKG